MDNKYHQVECINKQCTYNKNICLVKSLFLDDLGQCINKNIDIPQLNIFNKKHKPQKYDITCNEIKCKNNINRKCALKKIYINTVGQCEDFKWRRTELLHSFLKKIYAANR